MNIRSFICIVLAVTLIADSSYAIIAYDVYKYSQDCTGVPDVDKAGVPPGPPAGNDNSCWLATASNILAGAGWGIDGNSAQQNADDIYSQLYAHFTKLNPGKCYLAVNWWLYNYGYNPNQAAAGWYRPDINYSDVTAVSTNLTNVDYDHLLGELQRCQYVGVTWEVEGGYHCMTLVGGNWSNIHQPAPGNPLVSVWHDSDRDQNGVDDNPYINVFLNGTWTLQDYPTYLGVGYVTLCPGLVKPASAMNNYDYAYFLDQDANGNEFINHRVAGSANYGDPNWEINPTNGKYTLTIHNEIIPNKHKEVYLLVDYMIGGYDPNYPGNAPDINLKDANGNMYNDPNVTISHDGGQIMYHWTLVDQPLWEQIIFPSGDYYALSGDVKDFNIATECIPEPVGLAIILSGSMILLRRRRR